MITKSILLGGAMALALAGAGFAQQAKPDDTQKSDDAQSTQTQPASKSMHHTRHYVRHHVYHHNHMAALHTPSSRAERQETRDLNLRQAQYGASAQTQRDLTQEPGFHPL
jgi:ribulose kinase